MAENKMGKTGPGIRARSTSSDSGPLRKAAAVIAVIILLSIPTILYYLYSRSRIVKVDVKAPPEAREVEVDPLRYNVPPVPEPKAPGSKPDTGLSSTEREALSALEAGDYGRAEALLKEALKDRALSAGFKKAFAAALFQTAEKEARSGNLLKATELLSDAITLSAEPSYMRALADLKIRLGDLEGAALSLAPLSGDPKTRETLKGLYTELGDRNASAGDMAKAVGYYEKALRLDPTDERLSEKLRKLKSEGEFEGGMHRGDAAHFTIKFEGGERAVAGHLIGLLLEEAYVKVGSDLGFYPDDKIEALLYSKESFTDITHSPAWAGALFDGRIKIPAAGVYEKTAELEKAVFHEYTHALVRRISNGRAPVWLNEGLAEYEEGKDISGYRDYLRTVASTGKVRLKSLEGSFMGLDQKSAELAYLLSQSATDYIIRDFGVFSVKRVLERLGGGLTLEEAIEESLYMSYGEVEKGWLDSLMR